MRKNLPHLNLHNAFQFVTFRTQESVSYYLQKTTINTTESNAKQQLKLDQFLDNSNAGAVLYGELIAKLILFFQSKDKIEYNLIAISIMPNHIHILFQQILPLPVIMRSIKGGSSFLINKYNKTTGTLWDKGYFDKVIRNDKQFQTTYQYIKNNAISAHLEDSELRFYGIYEA